MDDGDLLRHYLERGGPDARWNLSAEAAWFDFRVRDFFERHAERRLPCAACNVGIGVGLWDDFLGYWLGDAGRLVSVDIDPAIAARLRYRQAREGHPHPAEVVCADALGDALAPRSFDLVTIVGSTPRESGDPQRLVRRAAALLRPRGQLLIAGLDADAGLATLTRRLDELDLDDLIVDEDTRFAGLPFHLLIARVL